jgi:signal transduction histidine kinase
MNKTTDVSTPIGNNLPQSAQSVSASLADRIEANRDDLARRCALVLREHLFTNRIELRPKDLERIAIEEVDAFVRALRTSFSNARERGVELSRAGLSRQSVLGLIDAHRDYLMNVMEDGGVALNNSTSYPLQLFDGFMKEREKVIYHEHEEIRRAFEIAIRHANEKTLEMHALVQKANENSLKRIIAAQEDERQRISRELHDDAGQSLVSLRMSLENLAAVCNNSPEIKKGLEKAIDSTNNVMQTIRELALRLRPPVLDLLGLNLAIRQLCIDISEQTGLQISYSGEEIPNLSSEQSISIYRIVQEALTNTVKHAHAQHAWIQMKTWQGEILLNISDDGQGFDPESVDKGIGLDSMKERSFLLNGKMDVVSQRGKPVQLLFSFPIV